MEPELLKVLGWIAGGATGIGSASAGMYKAWKGPVGTALRRIPEALDRIKAIEAEVKPNGGLSMKDSLLRIEGSITLLGERDRAFVQDGILGWWEADAEGGGIWCNRTFTKMTGLSLDRMYGSGWINMVHTDDRAKVEKAWEDAVEQDRDYELQYRIVDGDGKAAMVDARGYALKDPHNREVVGYIGSISYVEREGGMR